MSIRTYKIELRIDVTDDGHEAMKAITRQYARDMIASAALMCLPRFKPQAIAHADDSFYNSEEIDLLEPSERAIDPDKLGFERVVD